MVAGLIAMYISTNQTLCRNILVVCIVFGGKVHAEESVQSFAERWLAAHALHHPENIMRSVERKIPRVTLYKSFVVGLIGIHILFELPVAVAGRCKSCLAVKDVLVVERSLLENLCNMLIADGFSC